jgi:glycerophosphoryl diester phosphodiesterase
MALSADGRRLLPVLEGAVAGDDPTVRRIYEFDLRSRSYTDTRRTYRVADPSLRVSDFTVLRGDRLVSLERDNLQGTAATHKRAFVVDLDDAQPDGSVAKREVTDLLDLADPAGISLPGRPGDIGLGDPFAMPYVTIESVLPVLGGRYLAIVNDTNFGSTGRNPALPDDSDFVVVRVPGLKDGAGR